QAKKDNEIQQRIKALLYQSKIALATTDDDDVEINTVNNFREELQNAKPIEKAVLQSMLAEIYANYYQTNQRKIDRRTELQENEEEKDFRFWTKRKFQSTVNDLYAQSVTPKKSLQKEPIADWKLLLNREEKTVTLRPPFYDFLVNPYLDYLNRPNLSGSALGEKEKKKHREISIQCYKDLIDFHEKDKDKAALVFNKFGLAKLKQDGADTADYQKKLEQLIEDHPKTSATPYVLYELAEMLHDKIDRTPLDAYDERKELTEKALAYLDQIIDGLPDSEVAENAKDIKEEYLSPYLEIQVERIISPHRPAPMSILHKNLDTLFFKILKYHKTDKNFLSDLRRADDDHKPEILSKIFQAFPQAKAFSLELNHFDDYQFHRTTGKLDNLNKGKYVIMVSDNPDFSIDHENAVLEGLRIDVYPYDMAFQAANILLTDRAT